MTQKTEAKAQTAVVRASPIDGMVLAVMQRMEKREAKLESLLPKGVEVKRFVETIRYALAQEPSLLQCTQESMVLAVMRAARTGLFPDKEMAALVKYGDQATFVPMYKGLIALAKASGIVRDMRAVIVYERDTFAVDEANDEVKHLRYVPLKATDDRGPMIATYCRTILPDGTRRYTVLTLPDIARAKSKSRAGDKGPWGTDPEEMAAKASVKKDFKTLGVAPGDTFVALRYALAVDHHAETGEETPYLQRQEEAPSLPSGNHRLREQILTQNKHLQPVETSHEPEDPAHVAANEAAAMEPGSAG